MGNELVTASNINLAKYKNDGAIMGLEDVSPTDFIMPRFRLAQPTSGEGTPGKFISNVSGEEFEKLEVTVLAVRKYRVMWPTPFKRGDLPLCKSLDGKCKANEDGIGSGICASCEYSKWVNGVKPPCPEGYTFLVINQSNTPAMISFKSTSVRPVKKFLTQVISGGLPPFAYTVEISSKKEKNASGTYYVADFNILGVHAEADIDHGAEMLRSLSAFLPKESIIEEKEAESNTENYTPSWNNTNTGSDEDVPF